MKILLINPPSHEIYGGLPPSIQMPLGLASIAAALEAAGHNIEIIDIEAENLSEEKVIRKIIAANPSIVGITCTTPTYQSAIKICSVVKNISKGIKTVLGGIHPTIIPKETIKPESADFAVVGEGEQTIVELIDAINNNSDLSLVKGVAYKKGQEVIINAPRELIRNLDDIPFPSRHLFKTQRYTYPDSLSKNTFPISTSRGCPGNCTYCNTKNIFGQKFRTRSAKNVVDEIELLIHKYNAQEIHIWDDNFTTDKKRIFEIKDELKRRNIRIKFAFPNGLRADFLNEQVLMCLKDMGAYSIAVGVESGNQEILNKAKKGIKLEKVQNIFEIAKRLKIETWAFFMLGLWGETKETIEETIDFAVKLDPNIAKFHILKPYPGTEVYDDLKKNNLLLTTDYSCYGIHTNPVHRLPDLTADEILEWQKIAYRRFYFRPKKILQQLLRLRSLNRLKLNIIAGFAFSKKIFK